MRTFEIPGIGGIMVAQDTPEHRKYFENGKEAFFFNSVDDGSRIIRDVLAMDKEKAAQLRDNARNRSVTSGYSYRDRAKTVLTALEGLIKR